MTKFKTFLSSHTCTSKHYHSNHARWESGTDHRVWNWSQQPFQVRVWNPSESEINHSNYSRWVWNCHLCWQTPPSPQTEKSAFKTQKPWTTSQRVRKHQPPLNSGYTCPQNHKIYRKLTVTHDMFAVRLTLGCSLTNTQKTIEFLHYKPLRAQKTLFDSQSWGVQSLPGPAGLCGHWGNQEKVNLRGHGKGKWQGEGQSKTKLTDV